MNGYIDSGIYFNEFAHFSVMLYEYDIILIMVLNMIIPISYWYYKFIGASTLG